MSETPNKLSGCRLLPFYPANRPTYYQLTPEGLQYIAQAKCPADGRDCYVGRGTGAAHHRCGTAQCARSGPP